jgi:hypothetical protein
MKNLRVIHAIGMLACLALSGGCGLMPQAISQPTVHNPFPQLSRVAVAPFFNLSEEPTLNGKAVAVSYFNELQTVQGFEVVPVGVVEEAMRRTKNQLTGPADARRLAQILQVDALIIGSITEFSPYYPPRCGLQVNWYSANPGFHPIPPGYGLPWGTNEEQDIPGALVFEAEFALAKEQMKTQTPPMPPASAEEANHSAKRKSAEEEKKTAEDSSSKKSEGKQGKVALAADASNRDAASDGRGNNQPVYWPDPRGFVPPPPSAPPTTSWQSSSPVLSHTRVYNGNDADFTTALENYYVSRDEARFDGWQGYLQRSDDFVRFCCHMHIWEMLSARGGAGETRVVWRWPTIR